MELDEAGELAGGELVLRAEGGEQGEVEEPRGGDEGVGAFFLLLGGEGGEPEADLREGAVGGEPGEVDVVAEVVEGF